MHLLEIALAAALVVWCGLGIFHFWNTRGATILRPGGASELPQPAPRVSIIVAARNEQDALPATFSSLLRLDYPDYEVILVDDDSSDRTGAIADEWAAHPEGAGRLRVIHNRTLPPGWRGKVHALDLALKAARGEWILASDADVVFHPAMLRLALATALRQRAQLVSVAPEFEYGSFWEKVVLPAFSFLLATLFPLRLVNHPRFSRAIAAGAFILMRRQDFEDLGGYASLRGTLIEDLRTAEMFKRSGRRIYVALSRGLFHTRMYRNGRELWEGLTRSAFEGVEGSIAKILAGIAAGTLLAVLPWVAAPVLFLRDLIFGLPLASDAALLLALATCAATALVYAPLLVFYRLSPAYVLTLPFASFFYSGAALNSAVKSLFGRGVSWKDRRYKPGGPGAGESCR